MNIIRLSLILIFSWSVLACSDNRTPEDVLLDEFESYLNRAEEFFQRDHLCLSEVEHEFRESKQKMTSIMEAQGLDIFEPELRGEQRARFVELRQRMYNLDEEYRPDSLIDSSC